MPVPGTGHHQERPAGVRDGRALARVQAVEEVGHPDLGYAAMSLPSAEGHRSGPAEPATSRRLAWPLPPRRARRARRRQPTCEHGGAVRASTARGEGGDTTLAVDRAAEDAIFASLSGAFGVPLSVVSEERGELALNGGGGGGPFESWSIRSTAR